MIPLITVTPIGPLSVFGFCVAAGVMVGTLLLLALARLRGVDTAIVKRFVLTALVPGFLFAHLGDAVIYHFDDVVRRPALLLDFRQGLSSFCGFIGALAGAAWFRRRHGHAIFVEQCELLLLCFPVGWLFGRLGCSLIHDHPGVSSTLPWAVRFGSGPVTTFGPLQLTMGDAPALDLGLLEFVLCVPIALWCLRVWRTTRLDGSVAMTLCLVYGPLRIVLDAFRADDDAGGDVRFALLTPGQWAGGLMFLFGLWLWRRPRR